MLINKPEKWILKVVSWFCIFWFKKGNPICSLHGTVTERFIYLCCFLLLSRFHFGEVIQLFPCDLWQKLERNFNIACNKELNKSLYWLTAFIAKRQICNANQWIYNHSAFIQIIQTFSFNIYKLERFKTDQISINLKKCYSKDVMQKLHLIFF